MSEKITKGTCYCGAVTVECRGDPAAVCVCHCRLRRWEHQSATLFPWTTSPSRESSWNTRTPPEGKDQGSYRKTCVRCHSNVLNDHPGMGLTDIVSGILDAPFEPKFHIHYAERVWSVKDGFPSSRTCPRSLAVPARPWTSDSLRSHRLPATVPSFALYDV